MPGNLRLAIMLFSIFEKGKSKKPAPVILIFVGMLFSIFQKGVNKKSMPRISRFASMFF